MSGKVVLVSCEVFQCTQVCAGPWEGVARFANNVMQAAIEAVCDMKDRFNELPEVIAFRGGSAEGVDAGRLTTRQKMATMAVTWLSVAFLSALVVLV